MGLFFVIVSDLLACTAAGVGFGYFLRAKAGAPQWTIAIFSILGLSLGIYRVYRLAQREL